MMGKLLLTLVCASAPLAGFADYLDEARTLVREGDYWNGRQTLLDGARSNPKSAQTPLYNYLLGVCEYETGKYAEAKPLLMAAKAKQYGPADLYLGRLAFLDYDFDAATELYDSYRRYREKTRQPEDEELQESERQLAVAENSLERVEKIEIIDSIAVPADGFFKFYHLPSSSGRLLSPAEMPTEEYKSEAVVAFINEGNDFMMWGKPDSVGNVGIVESIRLMDGTWQPPVQTPAFLRKEGYADYPFMMPDGTTLYYASDGNESMGGYDIFVVTRDPQTGEYMQPQNIGMPFNSPYDDFMLAIDEENGIGWWATDRNLLGDKLTVYVYKVNDVRTNYDAETENLTDLARIKSVADTQSGGDAAARGRLLAVIERIGDDEPQPAAEFHLPKGDGTYYTSVDQISSPQARTAARKYLGSAASLQKDEGRLQSLRARYRTGHADNVRLQIQQFEKEIEKKRADTLHDRSEFYRLDRSGR